jgi:hypothetical protein
MMGFSCGSSRAPTTTSCWGRRRGAGVSESTSSLALAIEMEAVLEDIGAHPTRSGAIYEATPGAVGRGLHF